MTGTSDTPQAEMSSRHVLYLLVSAGMFVLDAVLIGATVLLSTWAAVGLGIVWLVAIVAAARSWRSGPWTPLASSVLVAVVWVVTVVIGTTTLEWRG